MGTRKDPLVIDRVSADELVIQTERIKFDHNLTVNEKFRRLNNILIIGNFLPSRNARYFVFIHAIAAKVSTLNDGTSPLRSNIDTMLISMNYRCKSTATKQKWIPACAGITVCVGQFE